MERAIGRIKKYTILKGPLSLFMSHIANQIIMGCALFVNFQPVLILLSTMEESDVDEYLDCYKSNSDENDSK